jgi:hypothetical protein
VSTEQYQKTKKAKPVKSQLVFPALEAPPAPVTPEQQQRLSELLQKYQADQITPDQYQAERAKILGKQ